MTRRWEEFQKGATGAAWLNKRKTHCKRGHPLSGANLYVKPDGKRQCRTCKRNQVKQKGQSK